MIRRLAWGILFFLASSLLQPGYAEQANEQQLKTLKARIGKLEKWLDSAKGEQVSEQKALRQSEQQIGQIAHKLNQLTNELQTGQSRLNTLKKQQSQLLADSEQQANRLAEQVRATYATGRTEHLKILLNLENPAEISRTLHYYGYFNRARAEQIEQYAQTLRQLEQTETEINGQILALNHAQKTLKEQHLALQDSKKKRQAALASLQKDISQKNQQLNRMKADRERLEELLKSVEQAVADLDLPDATTPIKNLKGKLPWPARGKVIRNFGSLDSESGSRWNGVLISAKEGSDVHAVHYGRVVFADWLRGFGLLLIIDHGNGYMSLYGHNQSLFKETGDWVSTNDIISSVGNSGGQKTAGLYFEIRRNGKPENPKGWMLAMK